MWAIISIIMILLLYYQYILPFLHTNEILYILLNNFLIVIIKESIKENTTPPKISSPKETEGAPSPYL